MAWAFSHLRAILNFNTKILVFCSFWSKILFELSIILLGFETKYADYQAYQTFKKVINPIYKHLYPDPKLNKQNVRNLQKSYYISTLKDIGSSKQTPSKINKIQKQVSDLKAIPKHPKHEKSKKYLKTFLNEETLQLNDIIEKIESNMADEKDEIGEELNKLLHDQEILNEENLDALEEYIN
jgi:hypothetical protein